ncbi:MAG TPA: hypothetical protein VGM27_02940 [Acidobacteriaceae bacterium]
MIFLIRDDPSLARSKLGDDTDLLSRSPAASTGCSTYFGLGALGARRELKSRGFNVSTMAASTMTHGIQSLT